MEEFSSPNGIPTTERSYFLIFRMNGTESQPRTVAGKGGIKKRGWPVYTEPVFNGYTDFNLTPISTNRTPCYVKSRENSPPRGSRFVLPYK